MTIKVLMTPHAHTLGSKGQSGIEQVVHKYSKYLPQYGIDLVAPDATSYDLLAIHAGGKTDFAPYDPVVAHIHGLHWTADYDAAPWEYTTNRDVIHTLRHALAVTVPSNWVAENIARDMRFWPTVIPHGVDWEEWQGGEDLGYVLWNKNRTTDVCSPKAVNELALRAPKLRFLTTFADKNPTPNIRATGSVDHAAMRRMVMGASVYLATTKETFGIATLEAMAAGVPVLGFDYGGTADLVKHGHTGYLARPGDYDDLEAGLDYCLKHRATLGRNAALAARHYTWEHVAEMVAAEYARTVESAQRVPKVAVVIPCYNKASTVQRAIESVVNQTSLPDRIIVVNNNSTDGSWATIKQIAANLNDKNEGCYIEVCNCEQQGVARARNYGIELAYDCDYIVCLDADDEIKPTFIETCYEALRADNSLAIAYTRLEAVAPDGTRTVSDWPSTYNYDDFLRGRNAVPTCCMFRRVSWERAGGYRQKFAPRGAGAEDVDLWMRIGAIGGRGALVTDEPLFVYYLGGSVSGDPAYQEVNWRADKPWVLDGQHPFASMATPENGIAHPVRQVDEPIVSVVIPVGPGHAQYLADALDSVEMQHFRKWECVVVNDAKNTERWEVDRIVKKYPFVEYYANHGKQGAGRARNIGASVARAPLLLFLDADDYLTADTLDVMVRAWNKNPGEIIYSDYYGQAFIEDAKELQRLERAERLLHHDPDSKLTLIYYESAEYDCADALRQPDARNPYIWNTISSLVPKQYHLDIGGFDETMESWEDWDYWLRLARAGKCFHRLDQPLLHYRFYSGTRRVAANPSESGDSGRQLSGKLLEYLTNKYQRSQAMPCSSCGGRRRKQTLPTPMAVVANLNEGRVASMSASDLVEVELIDGNIGEHLIVFQQQSYGYRSHGDRFMMRADHAKLDRRVRIVGDNEKVVTAVAAPSAKRETPPPPTPDEEPELEKASVTARTSEPVAQTKKGQVEKDFDLMTAMSEGEKAKSKEIVLEPKVYDFEKLWGIDEEGAKKLVDSGTRTLGGLRMMSAPQLAGVLDVSESVAKQILTRAESAK